MKVRILSVILIVVGLILLGYPKFEEMLENAEQQQLAREWQSSFANIDSSDRSEDSTQQPSAQNSAPPNTEVERSIDGKVEGMLKIDKINLYLPILHGATKDNMKTTLASIENTGKAGELGNYAIAGHRNTTYGRNFNRVDELAIGDQIDVNTGTNEFEYIVSEKLLVKPEDVWVLESDGKSKEITLVTCYPIVNPTHRLIIKGKIVTE
ncbi:class D sortase [Paenibacillus sp. KN14-4R]|uniref:class D sortase n=1 Tax=Paenibacillus sp. KN14-4R TaxID=3445773 RepID=UPI003FA0E32F